MKNVTVFSLILLILLYFTACGSETPKPETHQTSAEDRNTASLPPATVTTPSVSEQPSPEQNGNADHNTENPPPETATAPSASEQSLPERNGDADHDTAKPPPTTVTTPSVSEQPSPEWNGDYEWISYGNQEYAMLGWSYEQSELGGSLGKVTAYGIDSLNKIVHKAPFEAFAIKDVLPTEGVAVRVEIEGEIWYIPYFAQEQSFFTWEDWLLDFKD